MKKGVSLAVFTILLLGIFLLGVLWNLFNINLNHDLSVNSYKIQGAQVSGNLSSVSYTQTIHVTHCQTLDRPNTMYVLDNDLTYGGTYYCLTIKTNNITLDGKGHTLRGPGVGLWKVTMGGIATLYDENNILIENVSVKSYTYNLIINANNSVLKNIKSEDGYYGIFYSGKNNTFVDNMGKNNKVNIRFSDLFNGFILNLSQSVSLFDKWDIKKAWYYRAYVEDLHDYPVSNVTIIAKDSSGNEVENFTTNTLGYTPRKGYLVDYRNNNGQKIYYGDYTLIAVKDGEILAEHNYNITAEKNNLNDVFTVNTSLLNPKKLNSEEAYWANLNFSKISESYLGNKIQLVIEGDFQEGENLTFEIKNSNGDYIKNLTGLVYNKSASILWDVRSPLISENTKLRFYVYYTNNGTLINSSKYLKIIQRPTNIYWTDYQFNKIDKSYIGNNVRLVFKGDFLDGTNLTFEIKNSNEEGVDFLNDLVSNKIASVLWNINSSVISGEEENLTFDVLDSESGELLNSSNALMVFNYPNNTLPELNITSIKDRQMYFAGVPILFNSTCTDKEGPAQISWSIEGSGTDYSSNDLTFNETFTKKGMKNVLVTCKDSSGKSTDKQISILIIPSGNDPIYFLGYIDQPIYHAFVKDKNLKVSYSADSSYLVNINPTQTCNPVITCLAGTCPMETQNAPLGCSGKVGVVDGGQNLGFSNIYFSWKFDDGYNVSGLGNSYVSGSRIYGVPSSETNDKSIQLTESYYNGTENLTQTVERRFTLTGAENKGFCLPLQNEYFEVNSNGYKTKEVSLSDSGACVGPNGIAENYSRGDDCCPFSQICVAPNGNNNLAGCVQPKIASNFTSCGDYTTQSLCSTDPYRVADNPNNPERTTNPACGSIINGTIIQCNGCVWKNTDNSTDSNSTGLCELNKNIVPISGSGNCVPASCDTSSRTIQGCSQGLEGYKKVSIIENFQPAKGENCLQSITADSIGCASTTQTVKCVQGVKLPFFDWWEFLIVVGVIIIIYFSLKKFKIL